MIVVNLSDDTLIFMEGDSSQLVNLRNILQIFSAYTGLKVNYSKSMLVPINLEESESVNLAQSFGCSTGSLPFTYLGLHLVSQNQKWQISSLWLTNVRKDYLVQLLSSLKLEDWRSQTPSSLHSQCTTCVLSSCTKQ